MESCIGCKTCQIACKDRNDLQVGLLYREVITVEGGEFPKPWIYHVSMSCNHCEIPVCVENCPVGAMNKGKDNGVVDIVKEKCIGCQRCVKTCPYGAPKYLGNKIKKVGKCNLCVDLLQKGEEPVCVSACIMRALHFGDLKDLIKNHGPLEDIIGLPNYHITRPSFTVKSKKYSLRNP
ncbi:4Fe-4S ferredoxin, iron-sulfur binding domain protein [Alkaliphilus metalliredigens QYMF]|uniref:4Fe-4S ferredoxin, iron-sulfur binding domain protein n=2 Tax=Alkaliphilus TaxID=114627 RepID=A6TMW5_ALKMQ|nr:4Fe-4S ferredoxin, iron-sulfur binding domain protein [Alkaliphilus metalliredigens QYMF]